jgi:hypothetical protein
MKQLVYLIFAVALLSGCAPTKKAAYEPHNDPREIKATNQLLSEEAKRIEPFKQNVWRQGRTLLVSGDEGETQIFTNTFDLRCAGFDCDWFSYEGLYAGGQFFRISSLSGEFYTPDYLVSRKSGRLTSLIGEVTDANLSPDRRHIANAVGGDAGPDAAIYVWRIEQGELEKVYEYDAPEGEYAHYRVSGWLDNDTVIIENPVTKSDFCITAENPYGWATSQLTLKSTVNGWILKTTKVQCFN